MAKRRRGGPTFIQRSREKSPEEKALYHQVAGAGKSRVKREFFDLSDSDVSEIVARMETAIGTNLRRQTGR